MQEFVLFLLGFVADLFFWADLRDNPPGSRAMTLGCLAVVLAVVALAVVLFLLSR
jgi:hypothetical protein